MNYTIIDLDKIAYESHNAEGQSAFIKSFSLAWIVASEEDKNIMLIAWVDLIGKYKLDQRKEV
jgi:hypothetical protein